MEANVELFNELTDLLDLRTSYQMNKLKKLISNYNISTCSNNNFSFYKELFLQYKKSSGVSIGTLNYYSDHLNDCIKFFGDVDPSKLSKQDITNYLLDLQSRESFSQNTVFQFIGVLKNFMNYLEAEKIITKNHMHSIKLKTQKNTRYPLTKDDIRQIRAAELTLFEQLVFEFLLSTGCRAAEVCGIKIEDCDFKNNQIKVTGKGDKTRIVMFSDKVKKLLKEYKKECTDNEYLICIRSRGSVVPVNKQRLNCTLKSIQRKAKIKDSIYCHRMRHTFASLSLESGLDLVSIQTLMGHENLVTTQVYAKQNMSSIKNNYKKVFENE